MCMYEIIILCAHIMVKYESMTINNVTFVIYLLATNIQHYIVWVIAIASVSGFLLL